MQGVEFLFDRIVTGGFPKGSVILLVGEPGTGKTTFLMAIANRELKRGRKVLYLSFNELKDEFYENAKRFGYDLSSENFKFVDMFTVTKEAIYAQLKVVTEEIYRFDPDIVIIDSLNAMTNMMSPDEVRSFLHASIATPIKSRGSIAILTFEKPIGEEKIGAGVEEFVVDGVIVLRYVKDREHYRRVLEVVKMRRRRIEKPTYEYAITERGITFFDVPVLKRSEKVWREKISTGIPMLDVILDGGVYRDSITVIAGDTGSGKTTFCLYFIYSNALRGHNTVYVTFEESLGSIIRAMKNYGMDYDAVKDRMIVKSIVPESMSPVNVFVELKDTIERYKPVALAIDSYTSLKKHMNEEELLKMIRYLQITAEEMGVAVYITVSGKDLDELSTLADNIILLTCDVNGEISRRLIVLKSRSSNHSRKAYRYEITSKGVEIYES